MGKKKGGLQSLHLDKIHSFIKKKLNFLNDDIIARLFYGMYRSGIIKLLEVSPKYRNLPYEEWLDNIRSAPDPTWWTDWVEIMPSQMSKLNDEVIVWAIFFEAVTEYYFSKDSLDNIYSLKLRLCCHPWELSSRWYEMLSDDFKQSMNRLIIEIDTQKEMQA